MLVFDRQKSSFAFARGRGAHKRNRFVMWNKGFPILVYKMYCLLVADDRKGDCDDRFTNFK